MKTRIGGTSPALIDPFFNAEIKSSTLRPSSTSVALVRWIGHRCFRHLQWLRLERQCSLPGPQLHGWPTPRDTASEQTGGVGPVLLPDAHPCAQPTRFTWKAKERRCRRVAVLIQHTTPTGNRVIIHRNVPIASALRGVSHSFVPACPSPSYTFASSSASGSRSSFR
jgi:hypothetical protein